MRREGEKREREKNYIYMHPLFIRFQMRVCRYIK